MLLALLALANDSAVLGVGGTVTAFDETTEIRLVSEEVRMDFGRRTVEADFVFKNAGGATSVLMGFPEEGSGDIEVPAGARGSYFEKFASWVDGEPVQTELWRAGWDPESQAYQQWWTKTVAFGAGQTRRVRNVYTTRYSSDTMAARRLYYVLGTGKPWAGTIGRAKVVVDVSAIPAGELACCEPKYHRRSGNLLVWEFQDFEPPALTFGVSVGAMGSDAEWKPKPGTTTPGVGYVFRR